VRRCRQAAWSAYYIIALTDADNAAAEAKETNNSRSAAIKITVP